MKSLFIFLTLPCLLWSDIRETKVTHTSIMLMTEHEIYKEGYIIGIDVAREMKKIEATGLIQATPPVQRTSFCNAAANEAYTVNEDFAYKLAEKDNDAIFKDGIREGCLDHMQGTGVSTYRRVIKEDNEIDATDINAINALLKKAIPTDEAHTEQRDIEINELTQALKNINTLYQ